MEANDSIDKWLLGDAFMRGWYNIHDHDNLRIGFVPFTGSSKSVPETATTTPSAVLQQVDVTNVDNSFTILGLDSQLFFIILLVLMVTVFLMVLALVLCYVVTFFAKAVDFTWKHRTADDLESSSLTEKLKKSKCAEEITLVYIPSD